MSLRKMMRNARKRSNYGIGQPPPDAVERFETGRVAGMTVGEAKRAFDDAMKITGVSKIEANDGNEA